MLTITRAHIAEMIYTQVGLSRNEFADLLELGPGSDRHPSLKMVNLLKSVASEPFL